MAPVGGNTNSDDDRSGNDPVGDPIFDIRGVEEHAQSGVDRVRSLNLRHFRVQTGADLRDFGCGDPGIGAECLH
jgi:hypothetical protein